MKNTGKSGSDKDPKNPGQKRKHDEESDGSSDDEMNEQGKKSPVPKETSAEHSPQTSKKMKAHDTKKGKSGATSPKSSTGQSPRDQPQPGSSKDSGEPSRKPRVQPPQDDAQPGPSRDSGEHRKPRVADAEPKARHEPRKRTISDREEEDAQYERGSGDRPPTGPDQRPTERQLRRTGIAAILRSRFSRLFTGIVFVLLVVLIPIPYFRRMVQSVILPDRDEVREPPRKRITERDPRTSRRSPPRVHTPPDQHRPAGSRGHPNLDLMNVSSNESVRQTDSEIRAGQEAIANWNEEGQREQHKADKHAKDVGKAHHRPCPVHSKQSGSPTSDPNQPGSSGRRDTETERGKCTCPPSEPHPSHSPTQTPAPSPKSKNVVCCVGIKIRNDNVNACGLGVYFEVQHSFNASRAYSPATSELLATLEACTMALEIGVAHGFKSICIKLTSEEMFRLVETPNLFREYRQSIDKLRLLVQRLDVHWLLIDQLTSDPGCVQAFQLARKAIDDL